MSPSPSAVLSVKPISLAAPGRGQDLEAKISAPTLGRELPVILFSHGFGSSLEGYGPLTDFWAAQGFVVIQPTHLDSRSLGVPPSDPRTPRIWRFRVDDMKRILDQLELLVAAIPGLAGRVDQSRIAVAGHSFGGQTAASLLGLRVIAPDGTLDEDLADARVKAGVLLATAGRGGADLTPFAVQHFPFMNPSFAAMTPPALVIVGDADHQVDLLSVRGPAWMTDPYFLSPGKKSLLTLFGAEHSLGGIPGYDAKETTDENHERVTLIQQLTSAYLKSALHPADPSWAEAQSSLAERIGRLGRIESKGP